MKELNDFTTLLFHNGIYNQYEDVLEEIEAHLQYVNTPKKCLLCGESVVLLHGIPRYGMIFSTNGSSYSKVYDSSLPIHLAICDECVDKHRDQFSGNVSDIVTK